MNKLTEAIHHDADKSVNNYGDIFTQNNFYIQDMHGNISLDKASGKAEQIINLPLSPNDNFVGRSDLLARLRSGFGDSNASRPFKQVISGLGGVGKTQSALKYAYTHLGDYKAICWVECVNENAVFRSCTDFLSMAGEPAKENAQALITHWLQTHDDWLLILDDVNSETKYPLPKTGKGDILITTRETKGIKINGSLIPLDSLKIDEAATFLIKRTMIDDVENSSKLALRLGCLPLALEQVAAYINDTENADFQYYLGLIDKEGLAVFEETDEVENYSRNVKTTWNITLSRLSAEAKHILYCFAYMSPDLLALDLLVEHAKSLHAENEEPDKFVDQIGNNGKPNGNKVNINEIFRKFRESKFSKELIAALSNDIKRDKAVVELKRFSLVMTKTDKTLTMHSLLQEIIRNSISDKVYLLSVAEVLNKHCNEVNWIWNDYRIAITIQQAKALILNIETILQYQQEYVAYQGIVHNDIMFLPYEQYSLMAQYLYLRGVGENNTEMLEAADECYKKACEIGENFYGGGKDSEIFSGASTFAVIQEKHRRMKVNLILGRAKVAREIYAEVYKPLSASIRIEPGMTYDAFRNFGDLWLEFGFFNDAKECYDIVLKFPLKDDAMEAIREKIAKCERNIT
jgi:tetratricopeptide (TPR) repeat protein